MKVQGENFKFYFNNESKTQEEIGKLINYNTTVSVKGFDVFYSSPKINKTEDYLKQADEVQKQNGGRLDLDSLVYAFELNRELRFPAQKDREEFKKRIAYLNNTVGEKETEGKLDYSEINFRLLDLMAKRFMDNKHKYAKGNTLKDINKDDILWAAFRHIRKMIQPIENDPETYEDHLTAVATNMSIILDQLDKNNLK